MNPSILAECLRWLRTTVPVRRVRTDEDAVQETTLRAIESGAAVRHPRAFVARIARNIAIDDARKLKVRGGAALQLDELPDHLAPSVAADQETALLLKQVIMGLPPLYADIEMKVTLRCGLLPACAQLAGLRHYPIK